MRMLWSPARSPLRASNRFPGGTFSSSSVATESICTSLRTATREIKLQRRLTPVSKSTLVCLSAKLLITTLVWYNDIRYIASVIEQAQSIAVGGYGICTSHVALEHGFLFHYPDPGIKLGESKLNRQGAEKTVGRRRLAGEGRASSVRNNAEEAEGHAQAGRPPTRSSPGAITGKSMDFTRLYKASLLEAIETLDLEKVSQAIEILAQAREQNRRIFVCGNGGSAATASHFATEMLKGASYGRPSRFRILALNDSVSTITAYSNDLTFECVFAEQLKNFAEAGDIVMAFSSSGNSPNVLRAVEYGNSIGCRTIALTGRDGGRLGPLAQLNLQISHPHTGRVEDLHMVIMHMISYYFMEEERLNPKA